MNVTAMDTATMNKEEKYYDFNLYEDINDMIGYNGFITPEGKFYRVRPIGNKPNQLIKHEEWAYEYLKRNGYKFESEDKLECQAISFLNLTLKNHFVDYSINSARFELEMPFPILREIPLTKPQQYIYDKLNEINLKDEIEELQSRKR